MSDLAPFVAATLRDKVVSELHQEVLMLQNQVESNKKASQQVTITGPMGSPIFAQADYGQDGKFDVSPELWKVEFTNDNNNGDDGDDVGDGNLEEKDETSQQHAHHCTLAELSEMEVRIGGILKAKLMMNGGGDDSMIEGFVNDIDNNYIQGISGGALSIWFGGSSGIWLTILIQGIQKESYRALQNVDLSGRNLVPILLQYCSPQAPIEFSEVSFMISHMNHAMEAWGMPTEPPEHDDDDNQQHEDIFVLPAAPPPP